MLPGGHGRAEVEREVDGEIIRTGNVPHEFVRLAGALDKAGPAAERQRGRFIADDHVHLALSEKGLDCFSEFCFYVFHYARCFASLFVEFSLMMSSVIFCARAANRLPSAPETHAY